MERLGLFPLVHVIIAASEVTPAIIGRHTEVLALTQSFSRNEKWPLHLLKVTQASWLGTGPSSLAYSPTVVNSARCRGNQNEQTAKTGLLTKRLNEACLHQDAVTTRQA